MFNQDLENFGLALNMEIKNDFHFYAIALLHFRYLKALEKEI